MPSCGIPPWLVSGIVFMLVILVLVPMLVFSVAALCALPLWSVECGELGDSVEGACSYWEWFLYVMSNLCGLATPLTDISPDSDHKFAEIVDLLIAVWSIALTGTVIGAIGVMSFTNVTVERMEKTLTRRLAGKALAEAAAAGMLDLNKLTEVLVENGFSLSAEATKRIFEAADADKSGSIDTKELKKILEILETSGARRASDSHARTPSPTPMGDDVYRLEQQMAVQQAAISRLELAVGEINQNVRELTRVVSTSQT